MVWAAAGAATGVNERLEEHGLPDLMVSYQRGDPEAVDELVRRISPAVFRFLAAGQSCRSDAEDLLQECWIRIHRARHTYRPPAPVMPWIFGIARHTRLDGFRRTRRRLSREVLVESPPEIASPETPASPLTSEQLNRLLDDLPESQREVIVMLKISGMTLEEVARATSSTVGAIKQKAHRAYAKLRATLQNSEKK